MPGKGRWLHQLAFWLGNPREINPETNVATLLLWFGGSMGDPHRFKGQGSGRHRAKDVQGPRTVKERKGQRTVKDREKAINNVSNKPVGSSHMSMRVAEPALWCLLTRLRENFEVFTALINQERAQFFPGLGTAPTGQYWAIAGLF